METRETADAIASFLIREWPMYEHSFWLRGVSLQACNACEYGRICFPNWSDPVCIKDN
jgi:hypothetical protein